MLSKSRKSLRYDRTLAPVIPPVPCAAIVASLVIINSHSWSMSFEAVLESPHSWFININSIVEDNASPHNNDVIRESHRAHNARIVGYTATDAEKEEIKALIREQTGGNRTGRRN